VIGVGVTVVAGSTVFWAVRRRRTADASPVSTGV
jgi:cobalt/nickel transport system permease protein